MLDTLLTLLSVVIGLYVAVRMFRRSLRLVWAAVHGYVLSSWGVSAPLQRRPSAGTDGRTEENTRTDGAPQPVVVISAERKAATIALCTALRSGDATREEARALLAPLGISLSNDVWTAARPTAKEDAPPVAYTPIAGRPYDPREYFQDDPGLQYQPPAV